MVDNIQNEIVTIQRSKEVLKMLSPYMQISFAIVSLKKKYNNTSCTYSTPNTNFQWMEHDFVDKMWIL
jgi:hypothetical protein